MKEKNELKNKLHSLSVSDIRAMLVDTLTEKEGMKKLSDYEKKKLLLNLNQAIESKKDEKKRKNDKKKLKAVISDDSDESADEKGKSKVLPDISSDDSSEDEDVAMMKQKLRNRKSCDSAIKVSSKSAESSPKLSPQNAKSTRSQRSVTKSTGSEKESPRKETTNTKMEKTKIDAVVKNEKNKADDNMETKDAERKELKNPFLKKIKETQDRNLDAPFNGYLEEDVDQQQHRKENMANVLRKVEKSENEDASHNWFIPTELLERSLEPAQVEMITEEEFIADQAADLAIDVTKNATRLEESALVSPTAGSAGKKRSGGGQKWEYVLEYVPEKKPVKKSKLERELTIDLGMVNYIGDIEAGGKRTRRSNAKYGEEFSLSVNTDSEEDVVKNKATSSPEAPDSSVKPGRKRRNSSKLKSSPVTPKPASSSTETSPSGKKRSSRDIIKAYMKSAGVERTDDKENVIGGESDISDVASIVDRNEKKILVDHSSPTSNDSPKSARDTMDLPVPDVEDNVFEDQDSTEAQDRSVKMLEKVIDKPTIGTKKKQDIDAELHATEDEISAILQNLSKKKKVKVQAEINQLRGWSAQELSLPRTALNQIVPEDTDIMEEEGETFGMEELQGFSLGMQVLKCEGDEEVAAGHLEVEFSPALKREIARATRMVAPPPPRGRTSRGHEVGGCGDTGGGKAVALGLGEYLYDNSDDKGSTSPSSFGSAKENLPNPSFAVEKSKRNSLPNKLAKKGTPVKSLAKRKASLQPQEAIILKKRKVS